MSKNKTYSLVTITDLFGAGKGTQELLRVLAAGVSGWLKPTQMGRLNRAEINNAKGWLELVDQNPDTNFEVSINLGDRAKIRASNDHLRFQSNRQAIAKKAIEQFSDIPQLDLVDPTEELSDDWIDKYWTLAEKISSDEMQSLWAKIAVEKTIKGFDIPPRLLHFISLMDKTEIDAVVNIAPFVAEQDLPNGQIEHFLATSWSSLANNVSEEVKPFRSANEKISEIIGDLNRVVLGPIGVFVESGFAYGVHSPDVSKIFTLHYNGYNFHISPTDDVKNVYSNSGNWTIGHGVQLSPTGFKISQLCSRSERTKEYLEACSNILSMCGFRCEIEEC